MVYHSFNRKGGKDQEKDREVVEKDRDEDEDGIGIWTY